VDLPTRRSAAEPREGRGGVYCSLLLVGGRGVVTIDGQYTPALVFRQRLKTFLFHQSFSNIFL